MPWTAHLSYQGPPWAARAARLYVHVQHQFSLLQSLRLKGPDPKPPLGDPRRFAREEWREPRTNLGPTEIKVPDSEPGLRPAFLARDWVAAGESGVSAGLPGWEDASVRPTRSRTGSRRDRGEAEAAKGCNQGPPSQPWPHTASLLPSITRSRTQPARPTEPHPARSRPPQSSGQRSPDKPRKCPVCSAPRLWGRGVTVGQGGGQGTVLEERAFKRRQN